MHWKIKNELNHMILFKLYCFIEYSKTLFCIKLVPNTVLSVPGHQALQPYSETTCCDCNKFFFFLVKIWSIYLNNYHISVLLVKIYYMFIFKVLIIFLYFVGGKIQIFTNHSRCWSSASICQWDIVLLVSNLSNLRTHRNWQEF